MGSTYCYYKFIKMHGAKRVITFCCLIAILPTVIIIIPLYLRHSTFADVVYPVAESDIVAIVDGISSIFCQQHSLQMDSPFHAFQLAGTPQLSEKLKHVRLKKSMTLRDDTLEYWGFFLLKGAWVKLKVCSRYDGSRLLVVKGKKNLETCGLLKADRKPDTRYDSEHDKVSVSFRNEAEEIEVVDEGSVQKDISVEATGDGEMNSYVKNRLSKGRKRLRKLNSTHAFNVNTIGTTNKQSLDNFTKTLLNDNFLYKDRPKRSRAAFDAHIEHGGNAYNDSDSSSVSSFETELLTCYDGQILLTREFPPSPHCTDVSYLKKASSHMKTVHEVGKDGYYYYIFYSDNDLVKNDIHAVFDIYKPTYQFTNASKGNDCINQTKCTFPISFLSSETVIVEVPMRDGIEHEANDITLLVSRCHPRMSVYMIFPILVLFLVLICSFM